MRKEKTKRGVEEDEESEEVRCDGLARYRFGDISILVGHHVQNVFIHTPGSRKQNGKTCAS